jgi:hypothetical protein
MAMPLTEFPLPIKRPFVETEKSVVSMAVKLKVVYFCNNRENLVQDRMRDLKLRSGYSAATVRQLKEAVFDLDTLGQRGFHYEQLDQLTVEIILGMR